MFKTTLSILATAFLILLTSSVTFAAPLAQSKSDSGMYALLMSTLMTFGLLTVLTILIYRRSD